MLHQESVENAFRRTAHVEKEAQVAGWAYFIFCMILVAAIIYVNFDAFTITNVDRTAHVAHDIKVMFFLGIIAMITAGIGVGSADMALSLLSKERRDLIKTGIVLKSIGLILVTDIGLMTLLVIFSTQARPGLAKIALLLMILSALQQAFGGGKKK